MNSAPINFDHARDRRSLKHRYAEVEGEIRAMVEAAIQNELITRRRVDILDAWQARPFWGRLTWLLRGK
jgi:hypothetical protein